MLDSVEHGETIVVTRAGRRIASITPAAAATGAALNAVLERWTGADAFDDDFAGNVATARSAVVRANDSDPWTG